MIVNSGALTQQPNACISVCGIPQKPDHHQKADLSGQLKEFFTHIFNTDSWPARWHCGIWSDFHGWLYILSDFAIWAAYFAIPFLLYRIISKRKDLPFPKMLWLFSAFIFLCGTSHFLDAVIFWWPAYRLSALVRFATAAVSISTVFALYKALPMIFNLRTVDQLEAEICERKKAEEETRHLQIHKKAAEDLMAKKDEFISIASHELKTPVTSVKACLQLLERAALKEQSLKDLSPFVTKAVRQIDKLSHIVNDLLDVSRIQSGQLELYKTSFNLMEMIKDCADQFRIMDSRHSIRIDGDPHLTVLADRSRLDQVICNLLTNAFKYSPENKLVLISLKSSENGTVKVEITDHGIGIPEEKSKQIFDRFYRVEDTSQYFQGVGLGLYIASQIVKQHGGTIGVNSTPGKGSTFWFTI